jgi:hypothetical protein
MQARTDHTGMKTTEDHTGKVRQSINETPVPHSLPFPLFGLRILVPGTLGLASVRLPAYPGVGGGGGGGTGLLPMARSPIVPVFDLSSVWVTDATPTGSS